MNEVITEFVEYRGKIIPVSELKPNSNIKVTVRCPHGDRQVKWSRRNQPCKKCAAEQGLFCSCKKDRQVSWGGKISISKKGVPLTESHKKALLDSRIQKCCNRQGIPIDEFNGFPTRTNQFKIRNKIMSALKYKIFNYSLEEQDKLIYESLGYTSNDLVLHLQSLFQEGMTWENYGTMWHIDHIKPESWFKYVTIDDPSFKECWSLNNLQPMWAKDNIRKSNKYIGPYREPTIFFLCGQSGVGKTSLGKLLNEEFQHIEYDKYNKKTLDSFIANNWYKKPILLDISVFISTMIKRYSNKYVVRPIFLIEDVEVVKRNIASRGGRTENIDKRHTRILAIAEQYAEFVGMREEVLQYLCDIISTTNNAPPESK